MHHFHLLAYNYFEFSKDYLDYLAYIVDNLSIKSKTVVLKGGTLDSDGLIIKDTGINKNYTIIGVTFHQSISEFKAKYLNIDAYSFGYKEEYTGSWVIRFRPTNITNIGTWNILISYIETNLL